MQEKSEQESFTDLRDLQFLLRSCEHFDGLFMIDRNRREGVEMHRHDIVTAEKFSSVRSVDHIHRKMIPDTQECDIDFLTAGKEFHFLKQGGIAREIKPSLGARHGPRFGEAIPLRATLERLTDGTFRNAGPMEAGVERHFGGSALFALDAQPSIRVIVTERVTAADDPAFYALHGIDLATLRLLCVKAKNHFRAAFAQRCVAIIDCDAPGPAAIDLSRLPFRNVRVRP